MSQILVQIGATSVFEGLMKKADKCNCLSALILCNEAEGARTLNLRIDRLMLRIHNLLETQDLPKYTIWAYPQAYLEC